MHGSRFMQQIIIRELFTHAVLNCIQIIIFSNLHESARLYRFTINAPFIWLWEPTTHCIVKTIATKLQEFENNASVCTRFQARITLYCYSSWRLSNFLVCYRVCTKNRWHSNPFWELLLYFKGMYIVEIFTGVSLSPQLNIFLTWLQIIQPNWSCI
jgi:hypothetical protein